MNIKRFLFFACVFFFWGCQEHIPQKGMWAGTLTIGENKQLPFQIFLDLNTVAPAGYFLNGTEQTPIPEISCHGDSLSLFFSEYGAAMRGYWNGVEWRGKFFRYRTDTNWNVFVATPKKSATENTLPPNPSGNPLVGKYQVFISGEDGIDSTTTAVFWIKNDVIFGTFIAPDGDYGLLAGTQSGNKVTLTRFTGWQAFMMELEQDGIQWHGSLYSRNGKPMPFKLAPQAVRESEIKPEHRTTIKDVKVTVHILWNNIDRNNCKQ